jgi:hypothetical protein
VQQVALTAHPQVASSVKRAGTTGTYVGTCLLLLAGHSKDGTLAIALGGSIGDAPFP